MRSEIMNKIAKSFRRVMKKGFIYCYDKKTGQFEAWRYNKDIVIKFQESQEKIPENYLLYP